MLIRGVSWDETGPSLSFSAEPGNTGDGGTRTPSSSLPSSSSLPPSSSLPLSAGRWLRFTVHMGPRYCVGSSAVFGPTESVHSPCPQLSAAKRGYQCGPCFARDDFRFMHDFHRSGIAPSGLRAYLNQPHWLYIATFADGATKVGTASQRSKWSRLAEQGAVVAQYVALADDGRIIRRLEDLVTGHLGLTQQIRSAAKSAALLNPLPAPGLAAVNAGHARAVRGLLRDVGLAGFRSVNEVWERPEHAHGLVEPAEGAAAQRHPYPSALDEGGHGLLIKAALGGCVLAAIDETQTDFVVNLGLLKGRRVTLGNYRSVPPAVQNPLF
ncbi:DUF2797 domain-containing protein [Paeniglutamicibacter antarcticus]|uniref:DUF2797 domain-containing protein n=1 Tax=Arthrobacter terrae TaxID=2935737 RepID=A0A931CJW2_9MICC|nr:DUF2797 domain-containing protein [Arthrobacter terrae]MBG0739942.1 DUF2797 domain-containing protein [Arthrobacter terrae]